MIENKNALAELAAELKRSLDLQLQGTSYYRDRTIFCTPEVIDKAQRIIAELAKVRDTNWSAGYNYPEPNSSSVAISKCREIAEEGGAE